MTGKHVLPRVQIDPSSDEGQAFDRQLKAFEDKNRENPLQEDDFFAALSALAKDVGGKTQKGNGSKSRGAMHARN